MARRVIEIAGRKVGDGCPPIISAEVGLNHCGNMVVAREAIRQAARAGCDAVKFQNYRTADFVKSRKELYTDGRGINWCMWSLCQTCELSYDDLVMLKKEADGAGIIFHSTPTSREGVDDLVRLGVPVLKNGADYWENDDLTRDMLESGIPCIFSTAKGCGKGTRFASPYTLDNFVLIVLHAVREYPAKQPDFQRFLKLKELYPLVGYSDHTLGINAAVEAVKLGACWIEKHFTLDKDMHGPDHHFSADPQEMAALVKEVKNVWR